MEIDQAVEAGARAGFAVHADHHGLEPDASFEGVRGTYWRRIARAVLEAAMPMAIAERERLLVALHDAIRRPMGVTPDSAVPFYSHRMADEAEQRRTTAIRTSQEGERE